LALLPVFGSFHLQYFPSPAFNKKLLCLRGGGEVLGFSPLSNSPSIGAKMQRNQLQSLHRRDTMSNMSASAHMLVVFSIILLASAAMGVPLVHSSPIATSLQGWTKPESSSPQPDASPAHVEADLFEYARKSSRLISEWTLAPPLPISIMEHALVTIGCEAAASQPTGAAASIVLIGGSDSSGAASAAVYSFNINLQQWFLLKPMPEPRQAAMAVFSESWDGVVVCGGRCQLIRCLHPAHVLSMHCASRGC
jgi:hypothetical protein